MAVTGETPPEDGDPTARAISAYRFRFRVVAVSAVGLLMVLGWLAAGSYRQSRDAADLAEGNRRLSTQVETLSANTRANLCAWLYTLLANPPPDPTPDQEARFTGYLTMYTTGTAETPGLECPRDLPDGAFRPDPD